MPPASTEGHQTRNQSLTFLIEIAELTAHYSAPFAAWLNHADVVELLLEAGVDPNAADANGWTPLHYVDGVGHDVVVRLLEAFGATD